jgi:hypothetical protein
MAKVTIIGALLGDPLYRLGKRLKNGMFCFVVPPFD